MRKRKIRILMFEDVEVLLPLEKIRLQRTEFELITAHSGREVQRIVAESAPDLILLDRYMSDMGGDDCCRSIKGEGRCRGMPVIIVTPERDRGDLERCLAAGCDAVITRPINQREFMETIGKYLPVGSCDTPRYMARMLLYYGEESRQPQSGYSIDLSSNGLFLETDSPLKPKTELSLELIFPDGSSPLKCTARVAWSNDPEQPQKNDYPPGMGLQILDPGEEKMELLSDYIRKGKFLTILPSTSEGQNSRGMQKILIADDDGDNRKRLRSILEAEGYTLLETSGCDEALAAALGERPDLIITAKTLRGESWRTLSAELSRNQLTRQLPILLLSGSTLSLGSIRGLDLGEIADISRSDDGDNISVRVNNCLMLQQMSDLFFTLREQLLAKESAAEEGQRVAAVIQHSLLPTSPPKGTPFDFAWRFLPCERVGGDLFNVFRLDETHLGVYVMDVCGHGVSAAMVTTSVAQALDPFSGQLLKRITIRPPYYELISPSMVLTRLNREYPIERLEKHLTICYMILDMQSGTVCYSNAGHPYPVLIRAGGGTERLTRGGTIIGIGEGVDYEEGKTVMEPGDRLFLFTDGIIEYCNRSGDIYGDERFIGTLEGAGGETLQNACEHGIKSLIGFGDGLYPEDDITLLGIELKRR